VWAGSLKKTARSGTKEDMWWRALRPSRVSAVLAVVLACLSAQAAAADCPAAVVVRGPEPLRATITAELARAGIDGPRDGCATEEVAVTEEAGRLGLTLTDAYGRVTRRIVSDVGAACALIESRPGAELLAPLLPQGEAPPSREALAFSAEPREAPAPPGPSAAAVVSAPVPAAAAPARGLTLLVATELAAGSDNSGWAGLSVSGCVMLGPTCLGTLVRFWHDLDASDESANAIRQRDAGEIAISLALPFTRHRIEFRPSAELGVGWVHMGGFGSYPGGDDDSEFDHGDVSAGLRLAAAFPLSRHWALEAGVGASLSLFAHQAPFAVGSVMLPGEPRAFGLASLGFRYGVP
jgi:hypothetical protein